MYTYTTNGSYIEVRGENGNMTGNIQSVGYNTNFQQDGITVFGQQTLQRHNSAPDHVNIPESTKTQKEILNDIERRLQADLIEIDRKADEDIEKIIEAHKLRKQRREELSQKLAQLTQTKNIQIKQKTWSSVILTSLITIFVITILIFMIQNHF